MTDFNIGKHPPASPSETLSERLRADLKAYLDGELSPLPRLWIGWQIARNPACRAELAELARLGEDMKHLSKPTPRPELRARILDSLPPAVPQRSAPVERRRTPQFALGGSLAATLLLALMVGAQFGWWQPKLSAPRTPARQSNTSTSEPALFSSSTETKSDETKPESKAAQTAPALPSDPVSDAADKLAAQRWNDALAWRTQELARQQHEQHLQALAARARAASLRPVDAAITVPNVVATREELIACSFQAGGHLLENAPDSRPNGALPAPLSPDANRTAKGTRVPPASSAPAGSPTLASTVTTIAFAVPVSKADVLRSKLHDLGAQPADVRTKTRLTAALPQGKSLQRPAFSRTSTMSEDRLPLRAMQRAEESEPFVTFTVHLSPAAQ